MTWSISGRRLKKVSRLSLESRGNGVYRAYTEMGNDVDEHLFTKIIDINSILNDNKYHTSINIGSPSLTVSSAE